MKSVSLTAMLYPSARAFAVKAGDQIMVVAGVVVGIYTGNTNMPLEADAPKVRTATKTDDQVPAGQTHPGWRSVIDTPKKPKHKKPVGQATLFKRKELKGITLTCYNTAMAMVRKQPGIERKLIVESIMRDLSVPEWQPRSAILWAVYNGHLTQIGSGTELRKLFIASSKEESAA